VPPKRLGHYSPAVLHRPPGQTRCLEDHRVAHRLYEESWIRCRHANDSPGCRPSADHPVHVHQVLNEWAPMELGCTRGDVLEALAEELCSNEQLRAFVAGWLPIK
jgi:hypothetical protein